MNLQRPAFPIVLAAPSGAGKTTLARMLVEHNPDLVFAISATTRPPRPREQDGRDYHFVDDATFDRMIERDELVEWAVVHGRRYGTPRREVAAPLERGRTVLLDIDVQGARQVKRIFADALLLFILAPSASELFRRLSLRGSEDDDERRRRLVNARREVEALTEFDYLIVNDDIEHARDRIQAVIQAEWMRIPRMGNIDRHVAGLLHELDGFVSRES